MQTVEQALEAILAQTPHLPTEKCALRDALGRILAEDIAADSVLPPFDNAAVDGYAVRAEDTTGATPETPITLRTLGDIPAGVWPTEPVTPGTAFRIMTGAPMPPGADAAVMVEDTRLPDAGESRVSGVGYRVSEEPTNYEGKRQKAKGESPSPNTAIENPTPDTRHPTPFVAILESAKPGQHVRYAGDDVEQGDIVLRAGSRIRPAEIAMLATVGCARVPTFRPARVAVVSTGDELVEVAEGALPPPGKIRDSNRYTLAALVQQAGATVHSMTHITDDPEATERAFALLSAPPMGADVIVTAGGVSVGDRDFVKPVLEKLGRLDLWRVAMKPGKPLAFGAIGDTLFFGLPGNPASALVTFLLFVRPALRKMMGYPDNALSLPTVRAVVTEEVPHIPGRREYVRAQVTPTPEGKFLASLSGAQGSSILHSLTRANALLIVPEESPGIPAGETLTALLLD